MHNALKKLSQNGGYIISFIFRGRRGGQMSSRSAQGRTLGSTTRRRISTACLSADIRSARRNRPFSLLIAG